VARIEAVDPGSDVGRRVLRAYMEEIVRRHLGRPVTAAEVDEALAAFPSDDLAPPDGLLVVAFEGDESVGCGGVRLRPDGAAELTRMHVVAAARRRGIGGAIVGELEARALEAGRTVVRLDTRDDVPEARAMYARLGYTEVPAFNDAPYAAHWFEKRLA
jgi:GNAT superfamily N-acetyltransferase